MRWRWRPGWLPERCSWIRGTPSERPASSPRSRTRSSWLGSGPRQPPRDCRRSAPSSKPHPLWLAANLRLPASSVAPVQPAQGLPASLAGSVFAARSGPGLQDEALALLERVLVTGGAGTIGTAVVRRLLADGRFDVRVSDQREAPEWMQRECEVVTTDLRDYDAARSALSGCGRAVHLAAIVGGIANFHKLPHTLLEVNNALYNALFHAAVDQQPERLVYVSSSMVFERARQFPTTEEYLD